MKTKFLLFAIILLLFGGLYTNPVYSQYSFVCTITNELQLGDSLSFDFYVGSTGQPLTCYDFQVGLTYRVSGCNGQSRLLSAQWSDFAPELTAAGMEYPPSNVTTAGVVKCAPRVSPGGPGTGVVIPQISGTNLGMKWAKLTLKNQSGVPFTTDTATGLHITWCFTTAQYPTKFKSAFDLNGRALVTDITLNGTYTYFGTDNIGVISNKPSISISPLSPNGGENWKVADIDTIKWTSNNIANVLIEYTTDNGISWLTVVASTPASSGRYLWTIPNTPSTQCKVRITSIADTTLKCTSSNPFTIALLPFIKLNSPNGGENWKVNEIDTIKWINNLVSNVKIEYTTDNGISWLNVIASTPASSGNYPWTIPNTPSTQCKVRITDIADTTINSTSSNAFTITLSYITILSPNGGENWIVGQTKLINWNSSYVTNVNIEYSINNGTNWIIIASNSASTGSFQWRIPNTPSALCKVRITNVADTTIKSTSLNIFAISLPPNPIFICTLTNEVQLGDSLSFDFYIGYTSQPLTMYAFQVGLTYQVSGCNGQSGLLSAKWTNFAPEVTAAGMQNVTPNVTTIGVVKSVGKTSPGGPGTGVAIPAYVDENNLGMLWGKLTLINNGGVDFTTDTATGLHVTWCFATSQYPTRMLSAFELDGTTPLVTDITSKGSYRYLRTTNIGVLPVELSSFTSSSHDQSVLLNWTTITENNSNRFEVQRTLVGPKNSASNWITIALVKASYSINSPKQYSFIDKNLQSGKYQYRLKMIDNDGAFEFSKIIESDISVPSKFELSQNYPNPFNPSTKINYTLPVDSKVTLEVYNITGEMIAQLLNEQQSAGYYSVDYNSSSVNKSIPSGIYFYRLIANGNANGTNFSSIKKMMLIK
jgi:hypothetical protein